MVYRFKATAQTCISPSCFWGAILILVWATFKKIFFPANSTSVLIQLYRVSALRKSSQYPYASRRPLTLHRIHQQERLSWNIFSKSQCRGFTSGGLHWKNPHVFTELQELAGFNPCQCQPVCKLRFRSVKFFTCVAL